MSKHDRPHPHMSETLQGARAAAGLSQRKVANALGQEVNTYAKVDAGWVRLKRQHWETLCGLMPSLTVAALAKAAELDAAGAALARRSEVLSLKRRLQVAEEELFKLRQKTMSQENSRKIEEHDEALQILRGLEDTTSGELVPLLRRRLRREQWLPCTAARRAV